MDDLDLVDLERRMEGALTSLSKEFMHAQEPRRSENWAKKIWIYSKRMLNDVEKGKTSK